MQTILILKSPHDHLYLIDAIAERWPDNGYQVLTHYGFENLPTADIVILHVDLTKIPPMYLERLKAYPLVLNRSVLDISKSAFSERLVTRDEAYDGPVIVKTDANYGGQPEAHGRKLSRTYRWSKLFFCRGTINWAKTASLNPLDYPIYNNKDLVPRKVWKNPHLIVERFLPETEGDLYYVRYWMFLGDQGWAARFGSKKPIVKFHCRVTPEERVPVPDELVALRKQLGLDYGRFDYVVRDGIPIVFDINKTVAGYDNCAGYAAELDILAKGIRMYEK